MESNWDPDAALTPDAALAAVGSARAAVADRLVTPWWYHPVLGALMGTLVAGAPAENRLVTVVAYVVSGAGIALLVTAYRRMTGVWADGFSGMPYNGWYVAVSVAFAGALALGWVLDERLGRAWGPVATGLALVPVVTVLGRRGDDVLRAQLRQAP